MGFITAFLLPLLLAFIMFALGLGLTVNDFKRVAQQPKAFFIGASLQIIALPLVAYFIAISFSLSPVLAFGLVILALCPGGPTSNMFTRLGQGDVALSVSLTAVISFTSIFTVPVLIAVFSRLLADGSIPPINVTGLALQMVVITAVPVVVGMIVRHYSKAPDRLEAAATKLATVLVMTIIGGALAANWGLFVDNLETLGPAVVSLLIVMITLGTLVAYATGLNAGQTTSIAIETGIQNGALGIAIGSLIAADAGALPPYALPSALYGILMYLVAAPYVVWRRSISD